MERVACANATTITFLAQSQMVTQTKDLHEFFVGLSRAMRWLWQQGQI